MTHISPGKKMGFVLGYILLVFSMIFPTTSIYAKELPDQVLDFKQETQDSRTISSSDQSASFGTGVSGLSGGILEGSNPADNPDTALSNLEIIISRILGGLTTLSTIFFIIYFVLGAFGWITAGGDSSKINKGRDEMIQGALGMIVVVVTYVLIGLVGNIIGLDVLNPAQQIRNVFLTEPTTTPTPPTNWRSQFEPI